MSTIPEMTDVFQFMELRAPLSPDAKSLRQNYICDDYVGLLDDKPARLNADLQWDNKPVGLGAHLPVTTTPSSIGPLVYQQVFCAPDLGNPVENVNSLINAILGFLKPYEAKCPPPAYSANNAKPLSITELEQRAYILDGDLYYLLPERLEHIEGLELFPELLRALEVMQRTRSSFALTKLVKDLEAVFNVRPLREVVFKQGVYAEKFQSAKRTLFDTLYLLYILRRRTRVNLEYVIDGLRVLHVLEALSIDGLVNAVRAGSLSQSDKQLLNTLEALYPELQGWNGPDQLPTLPLIQSKEDFLAYFTAIPVIHPIFARLHRYKSPFNDLKPIGIGDLKVVKQWLVSYQPGEISHIENVLKGELKDRTHRRLEKTEESIRRDAQGDAQVLKNQGLHA